MQLSTFKGENHTKMKHIVMEMDINGLTLYNYVLNAWKRVFIF